MKKPQWKKMKCWCGHFEEYAADTEEQIEWLKTQEGKIDLCNNCWEAQMAESDAAWKAIGGK